MVQLDFHQEQIILQVYFDYKVQYEYFIEIKYNKEKIPGKGSCIVLHCKNLDYTQGCIAVSKDVMKELITLIDDKTKIIIREV